MSGKGAGRHNVGVRYYYLGGEGVALRLPPSSTVVGSGAGGVGGGFDWLDLVVSGCHWSRFLGSFFMPFIDFASPHCEGFSVSAPLHGDVSMVFSGERFCENCFRFLGGGEEPSGSIGVCDSCLELDEFRRFRCVLEGAGKGFGGVCSDHVGAPLCGDNAWGSTVCSAEHVVYLASFGSIVKVGVTGRRRGSSKRGFLYRLVEQGADSVVVLAGRGECGGGLSLRDAQVCEGLVSDVLGVSQVVHFADKVNELASEVGGGGWHVSLGDLKKLAGEVMKVCERGGYHLRSVFEGDLRSVYRLYDVSGGIGVDSLRGLLSGEEGFDDYGGFLGGGFPLFLHGRFVFVKGNLVVFRRYGGGLVAFNLHELVGRCLVCEGAG